jgi:hypothetical protein
MPDHSAISPLFHVQRKLKSLLKYNPNKRSKIQISVDMRTSKLWACKGRGLWQGNRELAHVAPVRDDSLNMLLMAPRPFSQNLEKGLADATLNKVVALHWQ